MIIMITRCPRPKFGHALISVQISFLNFSSALVRLFLGSSFRLCRYCAACLCRLFGSEDDEGKTSLVAVYLLHLVKTPPREWGQEADVEFSILCDISAFARFEYYWQTHTRDLWAATKFVCCWCYGLRDLEFKWLHEDVVVPLGENLEWDGFNLQCFDDQGWGQFN